MNFYDKNNNIVIVVVLYNQVWNQSFLSIALNELIANNINNFKLIVYDNSSNRQNIQFDSRINAEYIHNPENGKLEAAYNYALDKAIESSSDWLLLLDQDTKVDPLYFEKILQATKEIESQDEIVAIIPKVKSQEKLISPSTVNKFGLTKAVKSDTSGIMSKKITAINSGTLLKTEFIKGIGGFNSEFPLDMLDHWYFNEIEKNAKKVYVAECYLEHELTVLDYNKCISIQRYESIIESENLYYQKYSNRLSNIAYIPRLFVRLVKQLILVTDKKIARQTWKIISSKINN